MYVYICNFGPTAYFKGKMIIPILSLFIYSHNTIKMVDLNGIRRSNLMANLT